MSHISNLKPIAKMDEFEDQTDYILVMERFQCNVKYAITRLWNQTNDV